MAVFDRRALVLGTTVGRKLVKHFFLLSNFSKWQVCYRSECVVSWNVFTEADGGSLGVARDAVASTLPFAGR